MQSLRAMVTICGLLYGTTAFAQDPPADPNAQTPAGTATAAPTGSTLTGNWSSFLERPLVLAPMMAEPEFNLGIGNSAANTSESLNIGFNMGIMDKLQAGAALSFPVNPNADFGAFTVNGQYALMDFVSGRVDIGAAKVGSGMGSSTGFQFGLGAPVKYKLAPMFALTSGSQYATQGTQDIFYLVAVSGGTFWSFGLPIGILAQPHEMIAAQLRSGLRFFGGGGGDTATTVPLGIDVFVNVVPMIDVFFTFELPGPVSGSSAGYADERDFTIGARARFSVAGGGM